MWRLRRQLPDGAVVARPGDLVIDGRIRARLLRLRLLDLEAHIVVTPARPPLTAPQARRAPARDAVGYPAPRDHGRAALPRRRRALGPARAAAAPEIGRAEELIAEATSIIDEASRLH